ncbi:unnamed protein product [Discosporangium mesarthrocarpum]
MSEISGGQIEAILQKKRLTPGEARHNTGVQQGQEKLGGRSSTEITPEVYALRKGVRSRGEPQQSLNEQAIADDVMIVGKGIMIKGDVDDCGTLLVEGYFEGVYRGRCLIVPKGGKYVGSADVSRAEVAGRLQGTLHARSVLECRSSGRVEGTIRYKEAQTDPGGLVVGDVQGGMDYRRGLA